MENNQIKIYNDLLSGEIKISSLDPTKATHRNAVYDYVKDRPNIVAKFTEPSEYEFLKHLIKRDYKIFVYLKPEQYTQDYAKSYFYKKVENSDGYNPSFLGKSYEDEITLTVNYETYSGEEVIYFDNDIQTITHLETKLSVKFKVLDIVALFKKLDIAITNIGYQNVNDFFTSYVNNAYRKVVIKAVTKDKIGIYKLNTMHEELQKLIFDEIAKEFDNCGIFVEKVYIKKLTIAEEVSDILQKQSLVLLNEKNKKQLFAEYEKISLDNYAKKAEIHSANPNFAVGLTEAEKDLAVERYYKKIKYEHGIEDEFGSKKTLAERKDVVDDVVNKRADKPNKIKSNFGAAIACFIAGLMAMIITITTAFNWYDQLIGFGFVTFFVGLGIAFAIVSFSVRKGQKDLIEEQKAEIEEYESMLKNNRKKNESNVFDNIFNNNNNNNKD